MAGTLAPDWPRRAVALVGGRGRAGLGDPVLAGRDHRRRRRRRPLAARARSDAGDTATSRARSRAGSGSSRSSRSSRCWSPCPLLRTVGGQPVAMVEAFYRSGALVFGGGHVVLPLLHSTVVDPGWVSDGQFLAGLRCRAGRARDRCSRSPRTSARSPGRARTASPGAALATVAIFLPSFLLVFGALPFWDWLRALGRASGAR